MKKNNKKGFTLVELVIVVAVMAILVAVAIPTIGSIRGSAKTSVEKSNAQTIESIIKLAESKYTTVTDQNIADELAAAKLGITAGTFAYNTKTGDCKVATAAGSDEKLIVIETSTAGVTSVKFGDATGDASGASATIQ